MVSAFSALRAECVYEILQTFSRISHSISCAAKYIRQKSNPMNQGDSANTVHRRSNSCCDYVSPTIGVAGFETQVDMTPPNFCHM